MDRHKVSVIPKAVENGVNWRYCNDIICDISTTGKFTRVVTVEYDRGNYKQQKNTSYT